MQQYLDLLKTIKERGTYKAPARENMPGTLSLFGYQFRHDLSEGFPLLTTKKLSFKNIVTELAWFLRGDTNIKFLVDRGCNIWNEDAYNYYKKLGGESYSFEKFIEVIKFNSLNGLLERGRDQMFSDRNYKIGDCGKQYGWLWRKFGEEVIEDYDGPGFIKNFKGIDQLKELVNGLKANPMGRRHIITAWNPVTLDKMALNACHAMVQFNCRPIDPQSKYGWDMQYVGKEYILDCQMYQRSADVFLGVPYNIASYALLTHVLCNICNMIPGEFIHTFGDVHIYENHMDAVNEQLTRTPEKLPTLEMKQVFSSPDRMFHIEPSDFILKDYNPQPAIKAELSTGLKK